MRTNDYEALIILKSAGTEADIARTASSAEEVVKKVGGRVGKSQALGRRRLAFRIGRQAEGQYHLLRFSVETDKIPELDRLLRLQESIMRFVILSMDEVSADALTNLEPVSRIPHG